MAEMDIHKIDPCSGYQILELGFVVAAEADEEGEAAFANELVHEVLVRLQKFGGNFKILARISKFWREFQNFKANFKILKQISKFWREFQNFGANFKILAQISKF
jgi:hypothetical protein